MSTEINPRTREIVDALKGAGAKFDEATGNTTIEKSKADAVLASYLPTGITMDTVLQVQDVTIEFAEVGTLLNGEIQQEAMQANTAHQKGSLQLKFGHSTIETNYRREASGTAMGKPWHKYGIATTDVVVASGRKKGGYNAVVAHLAAEAGKVFAS